MFRPIALLAALGVSSFAACAVHTGSHPAPMQELTPTGKLRVGIGVGAVPSAFWATRDPETGRPLGVTVDLGSDIAGKLGVPLELVIYNNSGEVTAAIFSWNSHRSVANCRHAAKNVSVTAPCVTRTGSQRPPLCSPNCITFSAWRI